MRDTMRHGTRDAMRDEDESERGVSGLFCEVESMTRTGLAVALC